MSTKKLGATVINIQPKVSRVLHGLIANGTKRPKNTREPAESDFIIQDFPTMPNKQAERDNYRCYQWGQIIYVPHYTKACFVGPGSIEYEETDLVARGCTRIKRHLLVRSLIPHKLWGGV